MSAGDWAILVFLSMLWGGAFVFIEIGLRGFPPTTLVFLRLGIAALLLWGWLRLRGGRIPGGGQAWLAYAILGLLNMSLPFILYFWAQTHISAALASILSATTPLWGVLLAHLFTSDEKATPARLAGVALGIAGVALIIGPDALGGIGIGLLPQIACLFGALCYAAAMVYGRRFAAMGITPAEVAAGQMVAGALLVLPVALVVDQPWTLVMPGADAIAALAALATLSSAFAYILYFRLLETAGATNSLLVTFLIPVTAILLGTALLGEALVPRQWWGMVLIALGLVAIDGRLIRGRSAQTAPQG